MIANAPMIMHVSPSEPMLEKSYVGWFIPIDYRYERTITGHVYKIVNKIGNWSPVIIYNDKSSPDGMGFVGIADNLGQVDDMAENGIKYYISRNILEEYYKNKQLPQASDTIELPIGPKLPEDSNPVIA